MIGVKRAFVSMVLVIGLLGAGASVAEAKTNCSGWEDNRVYNNSSVYILIKYKTDSGRIRNHWLRPGENSSKYTCRVEKILPIIPVNTSYCMGTGLGVCGLTYHEDWWAPVHSLYMNSAPDFTPGVYYCRDWQGYVVGCV